MKSIIDALELLPQPAALYESPVLRFVEMNQSVLDIVPTLAESGDLEAGDIVAGLHSDPDLVLQWLAAAEIDDLVQDATLAQDEVLTKETRRGWFAASRLPGADVARPDLVLVTYAGSGKTQTYAIIEHKRAAAILQVNEAAHRTARMLEDALVQIQAALSAQQRLVDLANSKAQQITKLRGDTPSWEIA